MKAFIGLIAAFGTTACDVTNLVELRSDSGSGETGSDSGFFIDSGCASSCDSGTPDGGSTTRDGGHDSGTLDGGSGDAGCGPTTITALAAGFDFTCAALNGGAQCWGRNLYGQLGNNSTTNSLVPVTVSGLTAAPIALGAGLWSTCAVVSGAVECWGGNIGGQLGDNSTASNSAVPVAVMGLTAGGQVVGGGASYNCAVVDGGAYCWGANNLGSLGDNKWSDSPVPVQVTGLSSGVQSIAVGDQHVCALVNGSVWCWGSAEDWELGGSTTVQCPTVPSSTCSPVPLEVTGLPGSAQAIGAGDFFSCALINGAVWCWGLNAFGNLGTNSTADSPIPVQVVGLPPGVVAIALGTSHGCALVGGEVWCWGLNTAGQLGASSASYCDTTSLPCSLVPIAVSGLRSCAVGIAAGGSHTCAMVAGGGVQCWGDNSYGQLGDNSTTSSSVPVDVALQ